MREDGFPKRWSFQADGTSCLNAVERYDHGDDHRQAPAQDGSSEKQAARAGWHNAAGFRSWFCAFLTHGGEGMRALFWHVLNCDFQELLGEAGRLRCGGRRCEKYQLASGNLRSLNLEYILHFLPRTLSRHVHNQPDQKPLSKIRGPRTDRG